MTSEELAAIKARAEAATPGPWELASASSGYSNESDVISQDLGVVAHDVLNNTAVFIAHARTDVPALVAEVERLRALCQRGGKLLNDAWYDAPAGTISDVKALAGELEVAGRE